MHLLVQTFKSGFNLGIVQPVAFTVSIVQHIQDRMTVTVTIIWWVICYILPQLCNQFFHNITVLKKMCDVTSAAWDLQVANLPEKTKSYLVVILSER